MTARIPKSFKLTFKPNWYRMSVFRGSRVNLSTPTFSNINLTKKIEIYFLFQKLRNNGCNNLYFHLYTFDMSYKLVSNVSFPWQPGKSVNPNFPNINLTKKIEIYFLFQKLRNNGCNNLYFHLYTFDMSYKLVSYLTLLSECGLLNSLTPFTSNINLTEAITNLLVPWKSNQKLLQYSPFKT